MKQKVKILLSIVIVVFIITSVLMVKAYKPDVIEGTQIGNRAPEISLTNPDGKILKLSDLKDNLVLIDFWASWCGPCRRENPSVVAAYNNYKNSTFTNGKSFTIFSVSLDQNKESWKAAIIKDGLVWDYHVSDLKGWYSVAAQKYGIMSIPANLLIDKNRIILAKDLRGAALNAELAKYVKK